MATFFNRLTPVGRLAIVAGIVALLWGAKWLVIDSGYLLKKETIASQLVGKVNLPDIGRSGGGAAPALEMPAEGVAKNGGQEVRWLLWAWNAQMGLLFSNGGAHTTEGSQMAKNGVNLHITRQDDVPQMQGELLKFAKSYKDNPQTTDGAQFVSIMGDGAAAFLAGVNPELERLGAEYRAQIIYTCGKSLGEDKFMGLQNWKDNPQSAKGGVCATVLRDGDWNIVVKWCSDNNIKINPDEKTYDPNAMNFVAADTYLDAAEKYINGFSEEREVVKDGARTGVKQKIVVNGVSTWTPGDVNVAQKKGGLVSIVSTKEYRSQMPCVVIGIKKYMEDNRKTVESMIDAIGKGGDMVIAYPQALEKAAEISATVYKEQDAAYWLKYYKGISEKDKQNNDVELGGSGVHNLADNAELFGLNAGSVNSVEIVYDLFGNIVTKMYPKLVPSFPKSADVIDVSYLKNVVAKAGNTGIAAEKTSFKPNETVKQKVSEKAWSIEFPSGGNTITPAAAQQLTALFNDLVVANGLKVEIHGHTDNAGTADANMSLSEKRAFAVQQWLEKKSSTNFPQGRCKVIAHGQTEPLAPNDTPEGKAKNRRVTIVLGK